MRAPLHMLQFEPTPESQRVPRLGSLEMGFKFSKDGEQAPHRAQRERAPPNADSTHLPTERPPACPCAMASWHGTPLARRPSWHSRLW